MDVAESTSTAAPLFAEAVFELPNAQRREQKRFGASERAGRGHSRFELAARLSIFAITAAIARTLVRLRFFDATGSRLAHRQMPAIIHKVSHTRAYPSSFHGNLDGAGASEIQVRTVYLPGNVVGVKSACAGPRCSVCGFRAEPFRIECTMAATCSTRQAVLPF
jgi:hypothetical protein